MNREQRHAEWVKANWYRWTHTGSYCDGARVNMADVAQALAAYKQAVSGVAVTATPVRIPPPVRGLVNTHTEPDGALGYEYTAEYRTGVRVGEDWLQIATQTPQKPEIQALRVISLYHHTMTDSGRKAA